MAGYVPKKKKYHHWQHTETIDQVDHVYSSTLEATASKVELNIQPNVSNTICTCIETYVYI